MTQLPTNLSHTHIEELLRDADLAMYRAKKQGRGRWVLFEPEMYDEVRDRLELEADLQGATRRGELSIRYQPIFDLAADSVSALEALVSWESPSHGHLEAATFLPLAEEIGMIEEIGSFVLDESCRELARCRRWLPDLGLSVNVSGRQVLDPKMLEDVKTALGSHGLPPEALTLEVIESSLTERDDLLRVRLADLRHLGVQLAVDDFGVGFSLLGRLHQLSISSLKIDRSFIEGLDHSAESVALVAGIIEFGRALEIVTVAQGIETESQLERLRSAGCQLGQGGLLAGALDPAGLRAFLHGRPQERSTASRSTAS